MSSTNHIPNPNHTPSPNRLTSVEGQRVMAILDDCVQKLGYISLLKKDILSSNEDTLRSTLGEDAIPPLQALKAASEKLNGALEREDYEESEDAGVEVEEATLHICFLLKERPQLLESLKNLQMKAGNPKNTPIMRQFLQVFREFRDLSLLRLGSSVEDERARNFFFADMISKEKKMSGDLRALAAQLAEARQQRVSDSSSRKTQLNKLKEELKQMRESNVNETKALEKETMSREAFDLGNFTESETAKNNELENMHQSLEDKISTNKKKELMLRKKKSRVEKELENWIIKYDQDMEEKEAELALLRQDYERESKELKETEEAYDKLMKERETFVADRKRREALEKRDMSKKKRLNAAASTIQRAWKRYKNRKKSSSPISRQKAKSPKKGSPKKGSPKKGSPKKGSPKKGSPKKSSSPKKGSPKKTRSSSPAKKVARAGSGAPIKSRPPTSGTASTKSPSKPSTPAKPSSASATSRVASKSSTS